MNSDDENSERDGLGRFVKGKSGNRNGAPRKEMPERVSLVSEIFDVPVRVTISGRTREVTVEEAVQFRALQNAMAGKAGAINRVTGWLIRREQWRSEEAEKKLPSKFVVKTTRGSSDPQNAVAALRLLGIASRNEIFDEVDPDLDRTCLETWAVQAAIDRSGGKASLSDEEMASSWHTIRDAATLQWPKGKQR